MKPSSCKRVDDVIPACDPHNKHSTLSQADVSYLSLMLINVLIILIA